MDHGRYIAIETGISTVINSIIGAVFVYLFFGGLERVGLWGMQGLAFDLVPTTFMITLVTCIALTLITRKRLRAGAVAAAPEGTRLPRNPVLRGVILGAAATLLIVPPSIAGLAAIWADDWTFRSVLIFKIAFSALVSLAVTPLILRAALRDGAAIRT